MKQNRYPGGEASTLSRYRNVLCFAIALMLIHLISPTADAQLQQQVFHPETGEPVPAFRGDADQLSTWTDRTVATGEATLANSEMELLNYLPGGTSRTGTISGDFAYFNDGPLMVIVDLSGATPQRRGQVQFSGLVSEVVVQDDMAYVAVRNPGGGFYAVDISDKDNPTVTGSFTARAGFTVEVQGDDAFIGHGTQGFTRLDITDTANPVMVEYITASGSANGMAIDGDFLYVAFGAAGLRIYDISDAEEVALASTIDTGGFVNNAAVVEDLLYVSWASGFSIYDVSDRESPAALGSYTAGGVVYGSSVVDDIAYLSGSFGLRIIDVSDPSSIAVVSTNTPGVQSSLDTFSDGNLAVVSSRFFGLNVVDVTDPSSPALLGRTDNLGFAYKVFIQDDLLFVMDIAGKLTTFDISNPAEAVQLSLIEITPNSENIFVKDNLVYIADSDGGVGKVTVIDVTDPSNPEVVNTQSLGAQTFGVDVVDDRLYTASAFGGLFIFDRDDEGDLTQISSLPTGNLAYYVRKKDNLALIANFGGGLFVADISDESSPEQAGALVTGQLVQSMDFRAGEDRVALADGNNGITIVDISDPASPVNLGSQSVANNGRDVRIQQNYLYAAAEFFGIRQYEAEDLTSMTEISAFDTVDRVTGLAVQEGLLAGAGAEGGVYLFSIPFEGDEPDPDPEFAQVQIIHSVADPAAALVDFYVDGELQIENIAYGTATPYLEVEAGVTYEMEIRAAGTETVLISGTITPEADKVYSITATGVGNVSDFAENPDGRDISAQLLVVEDARMEAEEESNVEFYVIHASTDAPAVDVRTGEVLLVDGAAFGDATGYLGVAPDSYLLEIYLAGTEVLIAEFTADLSTLAGESAVVLARGFVDPAANQDGPGFELVAVLASGEVVVFENVTSTEPGIEAPITFALSQNYPNPFNPTTNISFSLPEAGDVSLEVFNVQGQRVATLVNGSRSAGAHTVTFDAAHLASGIYLYRLQSGSQVQTMKMMLVK
ncbi:MAG: DUF4397 domain-containing protein [Balneolia bacterium]|nr:DUF4397 domain-containing protein [Balneolia bacterium]